MKKNLSLKVKRERKIINDNNLSHSTNFMANLHNQNIIQYNNIEKEYKKIHDKIIKSMAKENSVIDDITFIVIFF